jgi:hypothetical protein
MVLGAMMQGEPRLGQRPGDVTGERLQRIVGTQRSAVGIGQSPDRVRQFFTLGESPKCPRSGGSSPWETSSAKPRLIWCKRSCDMQLPP